MIGTLLVRCKNLLVRWLRCKNSNKICPGPACQDTIHFGAPFKINSKSVKKYQMKLCTSIFISWIHAKLFVVIFNKSVETNLLQYKFILHSVKKCQKVQIEDWGKDISCPLRPFRPLWCPWFSCGLAELEDWKLILDNLLRLHCD